MISRNALQHKEEIFRLLQLSYPNMRRRMNLLIISCLRCCMP